MKKYLIFMMLGLILTGCSDSQNVESLDEIPDLTTNQALSQDLANQYNENSLLTSDYNADNFGTSMVTLPISDVFDSVKVDVDITKLSTVVAFSQVNSLMYDYNAYLGKSVKIQGLYQSYSIPEIDEIYHFIMLMDESNCCQGMIEFQLPSGSEYPVDGDTIIMHGEYKLVSFSDGEYAVLVADDYKIL